MNHNERITIRVLHTLMRVAHYKFVGFSYPDGGFDEGLFDREAGLSLDRIIAECEGVDEIILHITPDILRGERDFRLLFIFDNGNNGWDALTDYSTDESFERLVMGPLNHWITQQEQQQ
jgi:hypothetical protein